jgi:hypothetical protein
MFLREQLKQIRKELGEEDEADELVELRQKLEALELPTDARREVERELGRLERIGRESMETQVIRTYLETIAELPWTERSVEHLDLKGASDILEADHYALGDVKDRVLEFLAVRQLRMDDRKRASEEEQTAAGEPVDRRFAPSGFGGCRSFRSRSARPRGSSAGSTRTGRGAPGRASPRGRRLVSRGRLEGRRMPREQRAARPERPHPRAACRAKRGPRRRSGQTPDTLIRRLPFLSRPFPQRRCRFPPE